MATWPLQRQAIPWLLLTVVAAGSLSVGPVSAGEGKPANTYVYKQAGELKLKLDVYLPEALGRRPVVMWIHGGALVLGDRSSPARPLLDMLLDAGFIVTSIDYRLAPEVKAETIIRDVQDAYGWIRLNGPKLFRADTDKMAVAGGSAGAYLTLTSGFRLSPRPAVLLSLYGYGEVVGDWYNQPYEPYRQHLVSKKEAYAVLSPTPLSGTRNRNGKYRRLKFYMYCRQNGLWPLLVCGHDPELEREAFRPLCALWNVDKCYPPTFLIHGDKDVDVPYEQSVQMSEKLREFGVDHRLVTIAGSGHGFSDSDPEIVRKAYQQAIEFIGKYVKSPDGL